MCSCTLFHSLIPIHRYNMVPDCDVHCMSVRKVSRIDSLGCLYRTQLVIHERWHHMLYITPIQLKFIPVAIANKRGQKQCILTQCIDFVLSMHSLCANSLGEVGAVYAKTGILLRWINRHPWPGPLWDWHKMWGNDRSVQFWLYEIKW